MIEKKDAYNVHAYINYLIIQMQNENFLRNDLRNGPTLLQTPLNHDNNSNNDNNNIRKEIKEKNRREEYLKRSKMI